MNITADDIDWVKSIVNPICRKALNLREDIQSEAVIAFWKFSRTYDFARNDNIHNAAYQRVIGAAMDTLRKHNSSYRKTNKGGKKKIVNLGKVIEQIEEVADNRSVQEYLSFENRDYLTKICIPYYENKPRSENRVKFLRLISTESSFEEIAVKLGIGENTLWMMLWCIEKEMKSIVDKDKRRGLL